MICLTHQRIHSAVAQVPSESKTLRVLMKILRTFLEHQAHRFVLKRNNSQQKLKSILAYSSVSNVSKFLH